MTRPIKKKRPAKKLALMGILTALALGLSALERLIPLPDMIPGVKLGFANLVTLIALELLGFRAALAILTARVLLTGFLFGSLSSMIYALAGALCALLVMSLLLKSRLFSMAGVSIAGGVMHNMAQLLVAVGVTGSRNLSGYLPILLLSGALTGLFNGITAKLILRRIRLPV